MKTVEGKSNWENGIWKRKNKIKENEIIQYLFNKYPITAYEMQVKLNKSDKDGVLCIEWYHHSYTEFENNLLW